MDRCACFRSTPRPLSIWISNRIKIGASSTSITTSKQQQILRLPKSKSKSKSNSSVRQSISLSSSSSSAAVAPPTIYGLSIRPSPQLGLFSLLLVLSTAIGAIFSLAIISIPTINAFRRLGGSMENLSKVVSEEVPGTLSSLKLSALEINELTQQLTHLRLKLSATQRGKKNKKPSSLGSSNYPIVD